MARLKHASNSSTLSSRRPFFGWTRRKEVSHYSSGDRQSAALFRSMVARVQSAAPDAPVTVHLCAESVCTVCQVNVPSHIYGCGHFSVCADCSSDLTKCPLCMAKIDRRIVVRTTLVDDNNGGNVREGIDGERPIQIPSGTTLDASAAAPDFRDTLSLPPVEEFAEAERTPAEGKDEDEAEATDTPAAQSQSVVKKWWQRKWW